MPNSVYDQLKTRRGQAIKITIGTDTTGYVGTLLDITPNGSVGSSIPPTDGAIFIVTGLSESKS